MTPSPILTTPSIWDLRYMRLAHIVALWSKDPSTQCGAALMREDKTLASVGFNGFSRAVPDVPALYEDRNSKYPRTIHSEWNAIRNCRDHSLAGYSVYAWPMCPCNQCTAALIQKKIARAVYMKPTAEKLARWGRKFEFSMDMLRQKGVEVWTMEESAELFAPQPVFGPDVPKWAARLLTVAHEVASWSKDPLDPRGAVIVREDKTIAGVGFSGFPQGVDDTALLSGDIEARENMLIAAERNALLFGRDPSYAGHTAYLWMGPPSLDSLSHLVHEGITTIVYPVEEGQDEDDLHPDLSDMLYQVGGRAIAVPWSGEKRVWMPGS